MAGSRRYFGNVRRRESGRYQVRYRGPDGRLRSAPHTFARKAEAVRWLALKEAEISRGDWIDPGHAGVLFGNYAEQWLQDRVLKVRTADLYRSLLRNHLLPAFRDVRLNEIDEAAVRRWRKERLDTGSGAQRPFGPVTVAKAYRLLHAIFETAVDIRWSAVTPAGSRAQARRIHRSGRSSHCPSCSQSLMRSLCATARWHCWRRSRACVGVNWSVFAEKALTWSGARSGLSRRRPSWTGGTCCPRLLNHGPVGGP